MVNNQEIGVPRIRTFAFIFFQLPLISQSLKTFLTISKNCQANVLSTPLLKTECYKHTFCESFGLCFKFVLVSSLFFTKLSGVQSTNDGGLLAGQYSYAWSHWGPLRTKVDRNVRARCNRSPGSSLSRKIKGVKIQVSLHHVPSQNILFFTLLLLSRTFIGHIYSSWNF